VKSHDDGVAMSSSFFDHHVSDTLRQLAFLVGSTARQHRDLD
jgi:hypothetical protein